MAAVPALAQVRATTLEDLRGELSPGDFISLVQTSGESVTGRLVGFGDSALDIRSEIRKDTGKQRLDITVPLATIRSLERPRDSSRNGLLIGAGIGGGLVLGMFVYAAAVDYNEIDEWAPMYLAMGAVYTGVGALRWLGDRLRTFEAACTIQRAVRRNDENRSGSPPRTPQGHGVRSGFLTNAIVITCAVASAQRR